MTSAPRQAMRLTVPAAAEDQRHIVVRTRCKSIDELVAVFGRFVEGTSMFVATLDTVARDEERAFSVVLADGTTALRGRCVVRDAWVTADNKFRLPGLLLGMRSLTSRTKPVFDRMRALAGQPATDSDPAARAPEPVADISTRTDANPTPAPPVARRTFTIPPLPVNAESPGGTVESPAPKVVPPAPGVATLPPIVMPSVDDTPLPPLPATPYGLDIPAVPAPAVERATTGPLDCASGPVPRRRRHRTTEITKPLAVIAGPSGKHERAGTQHGAVCRPVTYDEPTQPHPAPPRPAPHAARQEPGPGRHVRARSKSPTLDEIVTSSRFQQSRVRRGRALRSILALLFLIAAAGFAVTHGRLGAADVEPFVRAAPLPPLRLPAPRVETIPARTVVEVDGKLYTVDVVLTPVATTSHGH